MIVQSLSALKGREVARPAENQSGFFLLEALHGIKQSRNLKIHLEAGLLPPNPLKPRSCVEHVRGVLAAVIDTK